MALIDEIEKELSALSDDELKQEAEKLLAKRQTGPQSDAAKQRAKDAAKRRRLLATAAIKLARDKGLIPAAKPAFGRGASAAPASNEQAPA